MVNPLSRQVLPSFLFQGLATFSTYLVSLVLMPLVLKKAGPEVYGSFVLWSSLLTLGIALFTFGAGFQARRSLPALQFNEDRERVFVSTASFQLLVYGLGGAVIIALAPFVQFTLFHGVREIGPFVILSTVGAFYLNSVSDDYFRYTHRIGTIAIVSILRSIGYPALVLLHISIGGTLSVKNLFLAQAVSTAGFSLCLWLIIAGEIRLRFRLDGIQHYLADIRYGFPLIAAILVENLLAVSDRYILGGYLSSAAVGVYASATAVGSLLLIFPKVSSGILAPAMARAVDAGRQIEAESILHNTLMAFLVLGLPFVAGAAIMARPLLGVLATPAIAAAGRWVVPLAATSTLIYGWNYITCNALFVKKQTGLWLRVNALAASISICLNLILLYYFRHLEMASIVAIISNLSAVIFLHRAHSRDWPVRLDRPLLIKIGYSVIAMCVVLLFGSYAFGAAASALTLVLVLVPAGVLTYAISLRVSGVIGKTELQHLNAIFRG